MPHRQRRSYPAAASGARISKSRPGARRTAGGILVEVVAALDKVVIAEHPTPGDCRLRHPERRPGGTPLLEDDFIQAFDSLYRAYVAKQVRALNLEGWLDMTLTLHVVRGLAAALARGRPPPARGGTGHWPRRPSSTPWTSCAPRWSRPGGSTRSSRRWWATTAGSAPSGRSGSVTSAAKQFLCGYEAGEIAHVENVLKGEQLTCYHRVLDRTEDTFTQEAETIEDITRELQTTDRFELKSETDRTIQNDLSVEISGQVERSMYGAVEGLGDAGVADSLSTTDSPAQLEQLPRTSWTACCRGFRSAPGGTHHPEDPRGRGDTPTSQARARRRLCRRHLPLARQALQGLGLQLRQAADVRVHRARAGRLRPGGVHQDPAAGELAADPAAACPARAS